VPTGRAGPLPCQHIARSHNTASLGEDEESVQFLALTPQTVRIPDSQDPASPTVGGCAGMDNQAALTLGVAIRQNLQPRGWDGYT